MKVTIIPADGFVAVDGVGFNGIDMVSVESNVHAVQWNGTSGEIERKDEAGKMTSNESIDSLDAFDDVMAQYNVMFAAYEAEQVAQQEAETVIEV